MTCEEKLGKLREHLVSMFAGMDDAEEVFHPLAVNDVWRMAEILGVDTETVPTERRALRHRHPSLED